MKTLFRNQENPKGVLSLKTQNRFSPKLRIASIISYKLRLTRKKRVVLQNGTDVLVFVFDIIWSGLAIRTFHILLPPANYRRPKYIFKKN